MKKIIAGIMAAVIIICGGAFLISNDRHEEADGSGNIKAAVLGSGAAAELTRSQLANGIAANIDVYEADNIDRLDILYITDSAGVEDAEAIESFVYNGGTAVLDNSVLESFSKELLGAEELVKIEGIPADMSYPSPGRNLLNISELIYDYTDILKNYENFEDYAAYDYGVGIIPSTAKVIAEYNGIGVYTVNKYGKGSVFITNPLLPGRYTVSSLAEGAEGEPMAVSTISAGNLLNSYFAEYVSKEKYGFAIERTFGSFASNPAAWELHYEDITGVRNNSLEAFSKLCVENGQMPSYTLARNMYTWFKRAESLTYLEYDNGSIKSDSYESAYCSGTHIVSAGKWLELDSYEDTESYFDDNPQYTKRLYPCVIDWNDDGIQDFICGSADGCFYYFEGSGMRTNYETGISTLLTDAEGNPLSVGAYSSPVVFDIDGDGRGELVSGAEDGVIRVFKTRKTAENPRSLAFDFEGIALETGLLDSMIDAGDLNGDGIIDLAVGSRDGEMRVYYGCTEDGRHTLFSDYVYVSTGESRIAPCIYGGELYGGTLEGYIAHYKFNGEGYEPEGYIEYDDISRRGNKRITIGMNCVPRFADLDGDGDDDLICGSLEYGMAYPVDSEYFPYKEEIKEQIEFCGRNNIYMGVHSLTSKYSTPEHESRELEYHKAAFEAYGLEWNGKGANQHTWFTSRYGYDGSGIDGYNPSYDGTFAAQNNAGLLWNSGFAPPESGQVPQSCAENTLPMPMYMADKDFLLMQVSNTPHGNGSYSYLSVKYGMPMLFYNHCDYIYDDEKEQKQAIDKVGRLVDKYDYMFIGENQMAKAVAAAYNTDVKTELDGEDIIISGTPRSVSRGLYDEDYSKCAGVRVVFADGINAAAYNADASVRKTKDNAVYVSLDNTAVLSKKQTNRAIEISEINLPAYVKEKRNSAIIEFKEGGLMCVHVEGNASTSSKDWVVSQKDGGTVFTKFGDAQTLKIKK